MKNRLTKEQKIGLFTIVVLAALYVTINYLRGKDLFGTTNIYYAVYNNVDGLTVDAPVYIKGLKIGSIQSIKFLKKSENMLVAMKVDSKYDIPDSSVAEMYSSDILGAKSIRIVMKGSGRYLKEKDTIATSSEPALAEMLKAELLPLKDQAMQLIESMKNTFNNLNGVLDGDGKKRLSSSLENLDRTILNIRQITANLNSRGPEISSLLKNIDSLSGSLNKSMAHLDKGLSNFEEITDTLKTADLAGTVKALKSLLTDINNPEGSIGKLIKSDSLHNSVDSLLKQLDSLINNINENPKKYIKISVF
jgi:phospholipid/cholesterol/gamma-HCH transport system substrate-binding protein